MASMTKILIWGSLISSIPIYLVYIVKEGIEFQIAGGILILSLASLLLFTGGPSISKISKQQIQSSNQVETPSKIIELPPPVLELEGPSHRRKEKLRRSRRSGNIVDTTPDLPQEIIEDISEIPDKEDLQLLNDDRIAMKYVAASDPQSQMESEIDNFIREKRIRRNELKNKITIDRRMEMAKRRTSKVGKWAEIEDGEDISRILLTPNHGLIVINESENVDSTIPHGISYVRIDQNRILKVRVPLAINNIKLNSNLQKNIENSEDGLPTPPGLPPMPNPPGLPPMPNPPGLPPMPNPPGLPPMPNPPGLPPMPDPELENSDEN